MDAAEKPVVRWIGNRDGVRVLLRRVNAIAMSDRYFGSGNSERRLARASIAPADKGCRGEQNSDDRTAFHLTVPCLGWKSAGICFAEQVALRLVLAQAAATAGRAPAALQQPPAAASR